MPATISVNFATQAEVESASPPSNKSVSASVLNAVLGGGGVAGGYVTLGGTQTIAGAKTFSSIITANGGIGIANGQGLSVGGVSRIYGTTQDSYANIRVIQNLGSTPPTNDGMYINYNSTGAATAHCRIYANGITERMIIRADTGNVGIGTSSPSNLLTVNGNIRANRYAPAYSTWSGDGDGGASIVNSNEGTYQALMIVGSNQGTGLGRVVKAWDYFWVQGTLASTGDIIAFNSSDVRLKDNVEILQNPLDKICKLRGVSFDWKKEYLDKTISIDNPCRKDHDVGVLAHEVQEVLPEAVCQREDGYLAVKYEKIVPLLIEAVKELSDKVKNLEAKLNS